MTEENTLAALRSNVGLEGEPWCAKCKFFDPQDGWEDGVSGWCRRFPPNSPVMDDDGLRWYWAEVSNSDWCGEFAPSNV